MPGFWKRLNTSNSKMAFQIFPDIEAGVVYLSESCLPSHTTRDNCTTNQLANRKPILGSVLNVKFSRTKGVNQLTATKNQIVDLKISYLHHRTFIPSPTMMMMSSLIWEQSQVRRIWKAIWRFHHCLRNDKYWTQMASLLPPPIENIHPYENKDIWGLWYAPLNDNCCVSYVSCLSCFQLHCGRCTIKSDSFKPKVRIRAKHVPIDVWRKRDTFPKGKK